MLRVKQSSEVGPEIRKSRASISYVDGIEVSYCGQDGLKEVASIFPTGDFTTDGIHRRSPTGGSANGIPRNWATSG